MVTDPPASIPRRVVDIDWSTWQAVDKATLTFVVRGDEVLLIRKKRGLGAGKINGPGGRIEAGESAADCAIREVQEELRVTPIKPVERGELLFQFADGYSIHVWVFLTHEHEGTASETDEAIPLWTAVDDLPFDEMWADDRIWLPELLVGRTFVGQFIFDGDDMVDHQVSFGS